MNCRHRLENGDQCSRGRAVGARYCWQHLEDQRFDDLYSATPRTNPFNMRARASEPQTRPVVTPDFIARLLAATTVDVTAKRVFAQEFCEAFVATAADSGFRAEAFMNTALRVPETTRP